MRANYQLMPYQLPTVTYAAGGRATSTLRDVPRQVGDAIAHVAAITFKVQLTPTLNSGSVTPEESQNVVTDLQIHDGFQPLFSGNFKGLRAREFLEFGRLLTPDCDALATTEVGAFVRTWYPGPPLMAGQPSDGLIAVAALENAEVKFTFGGLTDLDAQCTACTCTIIPTVWLALVHGEVKLGSVYEWAQYTAGAADINLTGDALYAYLTALNSSSHDAITAADFARVTVTGAKGQIVPGVDAQVLTMGYHAQMGSGSLTPVAGDLDATTADSAKVVNSGTPTALVGATAAYQPILWTPPGTRMSKMIARAQSVMRVQWTGANGSGTVLLAGRFLAQSQQSLAARLGKAMSHLPGFTAVGAPKIATLSKREFSGSRDMASFMAFKQKVKVG